MGYKNNTSALSSEGSMSFWSHVDEFRKVLIRTAVVVLLFMVALFMVMPVLFDDFILAPCRGDFPLYRWFESLSGRLSGFPEFTASGFHIDLINIQLASQFFMHITASFWGALLLACPLVMYFIWDFLRPALYPREVPQVRTAFLLGGVLFYLGVAVGYMVVFPVTFRFLVDYHVSGYVPNVISLDSYMDNFFTIIMMMGLVFELPLLSWLLGHLGVITRDLFRHYRRHAIVVLLILAAFITPTGDPFTLAIVFLPIYLLWEFSALLVPASKS